MKNLSRRSFLRRAGTATVPLALGAGLGQVGSVLAARGNAPVADRIAWSQMGAELRSRFTDLKRHFIFEYYPWYRTDPWFHWNQWDRVPPDDMAATSVPLLGPYDSGDVKVIEQHARWIVESGAGAINMSWWGPKSYPNQLAGQVMDVMAAHDIKVMFHIEPYRGRNDNYVDDIAWLTNEYGDKRGWDAMLLLRDAQGKVGPVFKSFRTIVAEQSTDCHGVVSDVADYLPDDEWNRRTDAVRERFRGTFDHVTLLADSMQVRRVAASGFDGSAPYDNFRDDTQYPEQARRATEKGLLFSFNCNPGFDGIARRNVAPGSCYVPSGFHPDGAVFDWSVAAERERARKLAQKQIRDTLSTSIEVQLDPGLSNYPRGFFLVFLNSFNEWHEGHQFEPAKKYRQLTEQERALGYHNPRNGHARFRTLKRALGKVLAG